VLCAYAVGVQRILNNQSEMFGFSGALKKANIFMGANLL